MYVIAALAPKSVSHLQKNGGELNVEQEKGLVLEISAKLAALNRDQRVS